MTAPTFTVLLCEGYHDRSFLAGALIDRLGWTDPGDKGGRPRIQVQDLWGNVARGDFSFVYWETSAQLRLRLCYGDSNVRFALETALEGRTTKHFDRLVVNYDGDVGGHGADFEDRVVQSIDGVVRRLCSSVSSVSPGHWLIDEGQREVRALIWHAPDERRLGVPPQQCLERLICASAGVVWPERLESIGNWLGSRPDPTYKISSNPTPGTIAKSHNWALMAGWFAEHGCDDFFREVWKHGPLGDELQVRLVASGAWPVLEACQAPLSPPSAAPPTTPTTPPTASP